MDEKKYISDLVREWKERKEKKIAGDSAEAVAPEGEDLEADAQPSGYVFIPACPKCSMPMIGIHECAPDGISKHFASQDTTILTEINQLAANGVFVNRQDIRFLRSLRIAVE